MDDNAKKKLETVEKKLDEHSLAFEILQDLKLQSKRLWWALIIVIGLWAATVGGFLLYLNQYDYVSTTTYESTGVYTMVDSNGNVIAEDITPEILETAKELAKVYGERKNDQNANAD